jgi:polygalacturonase
MDHFIRALVLALGVTSVVISANPLPTPAPDLRKAAALQKRASCTFTAASAASASKKSCATIVLDGITVPSGVTLDLTDLESGTHVTLCRLLFV